MTQELTIHQEDKPLSVEQVVASVARIQQVLEAVMQKDIHYGIIPGCKKPSLYKPGAEKLLMTFRIAPDPQDSIIDLSTADSIRYRIIIRGIHIPTGRFIGTGVGECSSDEEKYRWRKAVCKEEYDETPADRKRAKWIAGWQGKPAYQVIQVRTNPADVANTILKMAKKRAMVDLALTATAASDIFEQDIEDLPKEMLDETIAPESSKPKVSPPKAKNQEKTEPAQAESSQGNLAQENKAQEGPSSPWNIERIIATISSAQSIGALDEAWKILTPHIAKLDPAGKSQCQKAKDTVTELLGA